MNIYLAGKWEEHELIKKYADMLRAVGHTISFPWFELHLGDVPYDRASVEDLAGVRDAHLSIFIFEHDLPYKGAFVELGAALAYGHRVIIVGDSQRKCIFTQHPNVEHVALFERVFDRL